VIALDRLGAPEDRIPEYWNEYTQTTIYGHSLRPIKDDWNAMVPATLEEWKAWRGTKQHWPEQVMLMQKELQVLQGNTDLLVQRYAPDLLPGILGSLTHGVIHLGWAIEAESPWMICEGLAYLNFCYNGIDTSKFVYHAIEESSPMESVIRVADTFHTQSLQTEWVDVTSQQYDATFHPELVVAGFQWEIAKLAHNPHPIVSHLPTWVSTSNESRQESWKQQYQTVTWIYLATRDAQGRGDFFVLHLITSLWGLEHVCRVLEQDASQHHVTHQAFAYFHAAILILLSVGEEGFPTVHALRDIQHQFPVDQNDPLDYNWDRIVSHGIVESEEHNIKLVHVMKELWHRYDHWHGFSVAAQAFTLTESIGDADKE
jgi:hypothetical protein